MSIQDDLYTALSGYAALTALVSTRIYPIKVPQSPTYPFVVYQRLSNIHINSLSGSSGLNQSRYQFDIYAATYASANSIADEVVGAMVAATTYESIQLSRIDLDFDDNVGEYRISIDFSVWHN